MRRRRPTISLRTIQGREGSAGSIRLFDHQAEQANIAYTAYQLDGADFPAPGR